MKVSERLNLNMLCKIICERLVRYLAMIAIIKTVPNQIKTIKHNEHCQISAT